MQGMTDKPFSEYADRNGAPILSVLKAEFASCTKVLEIGSGTGQHAARFAKALPFLQWQTSDLDENHAGINAWIEASQLDNVMRPLSMDVRTADVDGGAYDAVYSSNTAHIMGIELITTIFGMKLRQARQDAGMNLSVFANG